jgi:hypothetical protein
MNNHSPKQVFPYFGTFCWLTVAALWLLAQLLNGCSSTIVTTNGCFDDDAGNEMQCNIMSQSTGGQASFGTTLATGGNKSTSTVGASGTGGSGPATTCDLSNYVNWSCGSASGPAAGGPGGTPDDGTPAAQWTCLPAIPTVSPATSAFGQMQIACAYASLSHVCIHC